MALAEVEAQTRTPSRQLLQQIWVDKIAARAIAEVSADVLSQELAEQSPAADLSIYTPQDRALHQRAYTALVQGYIPANLRLTSTGTLDEQAERLNQQAAGLNSFRTTIRERIQVDNEVAESMAKANLIEREPSKDQSHLLEASPVITKVEVAPARETMGETVAVAMPLASKNNKFGRLPNGRRDAGLVGVPQAGTRIVLPIGVLAPGGGELVMRRKQASGARLLARTALNGLVGTKSWPKFGFGNKHAREAPRPAAYRSRLLKGAIAVASLAVAVVGGVKGINIYGASEGSGRRTIYPTPVAPSARPPEEQLASGSGKAIDRLMPSPANLPRSSSHPHAQVSTTAPYLRPISVRLTRDSNPWDAAKQELIRQGRPNADITAYDLQSLRYSHIPLSRATRLPVGTVIHFAPYSAK